MEGQFDEVTMRMFDVSVQGGIYEAGEMTGENGVAKILSGKDYMLPEMVCEFGT